MDTQVHNYAMRKEATITARHYIGKFYKWGGDDPSAFDCSGLVVEILKSVGKLPRNGDWTANMLSQKFREVFKAEEGVLACYYNKGQTKIIHIEYCIGNGLTIGASGGGSKTLTVEDAVAQNAFIKKRPINTRRGAIKYVNPFV